MIEVKTTEKTVEVQSVVRIECDICHKSFSKESLDGFSGYDTFEAQEFHHVDFVGGYGSVFGDGNRIQCDICQYCLKKILGKSARVVDTVDSLLNPN